MIATTARESEPSGSVSARGQGGVEAGQDMSGVTEPCADPGVGRGCGGIRQIDLVQELEIPRAERSRPQLGQSPGCLFGLLRQRQSAWHPFGTGSPAVAGRSILRQLRRCSAPIPGRLPAAAPPGTTRTRSPHTQALPRQRGSTAVFLPACRPGARTLRLTGPPTAPRRRRQARSFAARRAVRDGGTLRRVSSWGSTVGWTAPARSTGAASALR